jgi:hypothetical protein
MYKPPFWIGLLRTGSLKPSLIFGNLLRYASSIKQSFRFDIDIIDNTVFFIRKENSPTELIPHIWGYNWAFSQAYTTWDTEIKGSVSHQRLIKYDFG